MECSLLVSINPVDIAYWPHILRLCCTCLLILIFVCVYSLEFSIYKSCNLQIQITLCLPFQSGCFLFLVSPNCPDENLPTQYNDNRNSKSWLDILNFFMILGESIQSFIIGFDGGCGFFFRCLLKGWGFSSFFEGFFFNHEMILDFYQISFLHLLRNSFCSLFTWYGVIINWFWVLNWPYMCGINTTWSWCIILFICYWIYFADFWRTFTLLFTLIV